MSRAAYIKKRRSVLNMGIKLYNEVNNHIKYIEKYTFFLKALEILSLQNTFYSVEKYM
jgi:hypothetical protein